MPLIPVHEKLSRKNPPILTILLIVINIFIFFFFQLNEDFYYEQCVNHYLNDEILDVELALYGDFLELTAREKIIIPEFEDIDEENQFYFDIYNKIENNHKFFNYLNSGRLINTESKEFLKWKSLRAKYEKEKSRVFSFKYGLIPGDLKLFSFFSSMFLHSSFAHLFGNMIFLWLVGVMLEYHCSRTGFTFIYLFSGVFSGFIFYLFNKTSLIPLVGASGAISGFMGAFTILFMKNRVKVFLFLGFYFNYFRLPAIMLLPIWILNEIYPLLMEAESSIAYECHIGGLLFGVLSGLIYKSITNKKIEIKKVNDSIHDVSILADEGVALMGKLDFEGARIKFRKAVELSGNDMDLKIYLFNAEKNFPHESYFHISAKNLIFSLFENGDFEKAHEYFEQYMEISKPKLGVDDFLYIAESFVKSGFLASGEKIMKSLIRHQPKLSGLSQLIFRFAVECKKQGDFKKSRAYLNFIEKNYKGTQEYESLKLKRSN